MVNLMKLVLFLTITIFYCASAAADMVNKRSAVHEGSKYHRKDGLSGRLRIFIERMFLLNILIFPQE
jgi:hypothetical protein